MLYKLNNTGGNFAGIIIKARMLFPSPFQQKKLKNTKILKNLKRFECKFIGVFNFLVYFECS